MEVTFKCSECGNEVTESGKPIVDSWGNVTLTVIPCETCLKAEHDVAYRDGVTDTKEGE